MTAHATPSPDGSFVPQRTYLCIDLKSFYASVECAARGLDPFTTNLVVADPDRTDTTICLAITPAMKELGIRNRCRVFEIPPDVEYIMAKPRMRHYMQVSTQIYGIYLRYISPQDMHVYSIDECFIDATPYLSLYRMTAKELAVMLMDAVQQETGICATAGIGTNLFLAKVALDITAKHADDHIGFLDENAFRRTIWRHRPLTDIWNIGPGIARRLSKYHVFDLKGVTELDPETLYREFGVNAEYLIDHAWGLEPCTIAQIQAYEPDATSISNGQVLPCDYAWDEARMVLREMVEATVLELVDRHLVTDRIQLSVGYAHDKTAPPSGEPVFIGEHGKHYASRYSGRTGGSRKLPERTNSASALLGYFLDLYDQTTRTDRPVRRIHLGFGNLLDEDFATVDLFTDVAAREKERKLAQAMLAVKDRFGKNAMLKGTSLQEKSTARERNQQVGGHHA
ncbi:MAG: DNA repair protein [Coriobacteriia bacterium]|nr:DNA repair protein [Coriobacteriia bacterium]